MTSQTEPGEGRDEEFNRWAHSQTGPFVEDPIVTDKQLRIAYRAWNAALSTPSAPVSPETE